MTRKAYLAKAGLKLSDSGGRQVVDKWYGMEGGDAVFSGSDRPEFNPLDPAVCVEEERENLIDSQYTFEDEMPAPLAEAEHYGIKALYSDNVTSDVEVPGLDPSATYAVSGWVYLPSAFNFPTWEFRAANSGSFVDSIEADMSIRDEWQYVHGTLTGADHISARVGGGGGNRERWSTLLKVEEGGYTTLWHPPGTTRLAPNPVLEDFLPLTGTVAGKVDMVRSDSEDQYIFCTDGPASTDRSFLTLFTSGIIQARIYGSDGGVVEASLPIIVANNERFKMEWAVSWGENNIYLILRDGEEKHLYQDAFTANDSVFRDVMIGADRGSRQSSTRFKSLHTDTITRTTESELSDLLDRL